MVPSPVQLALVQEGAAEAVQQDEDTPRDRRHFLRHAHDMNPKMPEAPWLAPWRRAARHPSSELDSEDTARTDRERSPR